jgi:hypothetical protein
MRDAVQAETYKIDGVEVSNFLLPLYFTGSEEVGGRNDFLGNSHKGKTLQSFGVNPGGYIGFFDPKSGRTRTSRGPETGSPGNVWPSSAGDGRRGEAFDISGFQWE